MKLTRSILDLGLQEPLRFLHITDNHLAYADERDDSRKQELARSRSAAFENTAGECEIFLDEAISYAQKNCDLLLHTGDLIDFVSHKNLEIVRQKLTGVDYFFATGNHEFSLYVGEAFEDLPYKMRSMDQVQSFFKNNLLFASRIINGLNLVAIDNSYYHFSEQQLKQFMAEVSKGYPIVLLLHNPICTDDLFDKMMALHQNKCAYLVGCTENQLASFTPERKRQQCPLPSTMAFIDYLKQQPLVKAVIAGHLHLNHESMLTGNIKQYVTGGGYEGVAREFVIS